MRQTHTFVVLNISQSSYDEIRSKLERAGYSHCFYENGNIDMHGIAVNVENENDGITLIEQENI